MYGEGVSVYKSKDSDWEPIVDGLGVHLGIYNINGKRYYYIRNKGTNIEEFDLKKATKDQYQLKIVIDIESGKLEEVDFGELVGDGITIDKIEEIQKSINICKEENGKVSYGRIAPIRDISAILSLVKEYYSMLDKTDKLNVIDYQDDLIKQINKSGIRFLCFTEGENGDPQIKRDRFNEIVIRAIEEGVECVSAMYSLEATNTLTMEHSRHSIVAMGFKVDGNDKIIIKTFDSSGASYKKLHENSMGTDDDVFIYSQKEGWVTEQTPQGTISNCSYWGEGDLIVVFKKHLGGSGITKDHLINQKKWNEEVLNEIKTEVQNVLMRRIVDNIANINPPQTENSISQKESQQKVCPFVASIKEIGRQMRKREQQEDLNKKEVIQGNSQNKTPTDLPQSTSDGNGEGTPTEETPIIQEHEQIRSILPHSFCNITTSNNPSTSSPQQTQLNTLQAPPKQSTVPLLK